MRAIMKIIERMQASFQEGTQISQFNMIAAAIIGGTGHFLLYFVYKYLFQHNWENLPFRLVAVVLSIGVLLRLRHPDFLGKYFLYFWHVMLIYMLPFIITLFALKNNFEQPWLYWEIFMIFVLMSFVPNMFMFLFDLLSGLAAAYAVFLISSPNTEIISTFSVAEYSIVAVFSIVAGYVFSLSNIRGIVAQEKNTALQMLAASIAHEMRNPLGQVKFSFEKILQELPIEHQEKMVEQISADALDRVYLSVAQGQMAVNRGGQIINMLLNETKNKSIDQDNFTYCSCQSITRKALDEYGYESDEERRKLTLDVQEDFFIRVDETLYIFVLFNLIINAFYFIKPYPDARITIRIEKGASRNRVYVRDTGPGIPSENLDKLFDAFFTSGKKGGTGLGLAYCKRVMHAFQGDIVCDSVEGEYTEFMLTFQKEEADKLNDFRNAMISEYKALFNNKRLLIVDDEMVDRQKIVEQLKPFNVSISEAENGQQAIDQLQKKRYDVVLMNLNMPVMNGYEATESIRSGKAGQSLSNIPIIGFTSSPPYIARAKSEKVGMQGFIAKPVEEFELITNIATALKAASINGKATFAGLTILLVDDATVIRLSLKGMLEKLQINIVEAVNGTRAIEHLKNNGHPCDLILMDFQMPGLDGLETTRIIRNELGSHHKNIPIIGLSGESDEREIAKALHAGMNDYLYKPVDNYLLINKIGRWVNTKQTLQSECL